MKLSINGSGTTLFSGPRKQVEAINNALGAITHGDKIWLLDCDKILQYPAIEIAMNDFTLTVSSQTLFTGASIMG